MRKTYSYMVTGEKVYTNVYVTAFGAVGDGVADDTAAIQSALDSVRDGGTIIFPAGVYKLTGSVYFYSHQRLIFEGGATLLQGAPLNNLLMNYSTAAMGGYEATENVVIDGATFDGGACTTNNTLMGICHSKNITIRGCSFRNGYGAWHDLEINSSKNVLVSDCVFEGLRRTDKNACLIQVDSFNNTDTWPWGNGLVDGTVSRMVDIRNSFFHDCAIAPAIGNHSTSVVDCIRIHDCIFEGLTSNRGAINFQSAKNVDVYNNTFDGCTSGVTIGTSDGPNTVHDNRFIDVTQVCGNGIGAYNNTVNGRLTIEVGASTSGLLDATVE